LVNKSNIPSIGIDLGTTNSVIAHRDRTGHPLTLRNADGELTTPSVVYFHPSAVVVGREAAKMALFEPHRVAQFAKRDIGNIRYHRPVCGQHLPPEVIEALVLQKLVSDARLRMGDFRKVVVTVPAYFNEPRRKATQDAGRLAGLDVLDIINEPTAAAIAFGVQQGFLSDKGVARYRERVLVYDLGGGTFDATLMELNGRRFSALGTAGDVHLGGIDWNRRLANYLATAFQETHGVDVCADPIGAQTLLAEAEDAKRALSTRDEVVIHLAFDGHRLGVRVTREMFEHMTEDLVMRTSFTINKLLRDASLDWDDITRVLLVGGSTRMPMIQEMLKRESGQDLDRSLSPDEAVAHGAAIYADLLLHAADTERPQVEVINVNSHNLGVLGVEKETGRPRTKVLIPRNTPLPTKGLGRFVTAKKNQTSVAVRVVEGGDASGKNATAIGKCVVRHLPEGLPEKTTVEVKFRYTSDGRLAVQAWLPSAECEASLVIQRAAGMSDSAIQRWQQRIEQGLCLEGEPLQESATAEPGDSFGCDKPRKEAETARPVKEESFSSVADPDVVESLLEESDELPSSDVKSEVEPVDLDSPSSDQGSDDALDDFFRQFNR
jgi:molecular chaperone DnaK